MIQRFPRSGIMLLILLLTSCGQKNVVVWTIRDVMAMYFFGFLLVVAILMGIALTIEHYVSTWRERRRKKTKNEPPSGLRY